MIKTYLVLNKYTQSVVDVFLTESEAQIAIKGYEQDDREANNYIKDAYFISLRNIKDEPNF